MSQVSDTHGNNELRLRHIEFNASQYKPEETGIIILGDAGFNFWLNKNDRINKAAAANVGYTVYCVRGNHEERPENIDSYHLIYDANVGNMVWVEDDFPNLRFFADGGNYVIDGHPVLVVGGAYSVDKWHRLARAGYRAEQALEANPKKCGWFKDECLTQEEMNAIIESNKGKKFDFVFSHTCPIDWEPSDLFIGGVDQTTVDKSMEYWLNDLKETFNWGVWCFGHYHCDRIERPHVEQFFTDYEPLSTVWERWKRYDEIGDLDWWITVSPDFEGNNND